MFMKMNKLTKSKTLFFILALTLVVSGVFIYRKKHKHHEDPPEPYSSLQDIQAKRQQLAQKQLGTETGLLFKNKQWVLLSKKLHDLPSDQALQEISKLISAFYTEGLFKSFVQDDYDELNEVILTLLNQTPNTVFLKSRGFSAQYLRIPVPSKTSKAHQLENSWIKQKPKTQDEVVKLVVIKEITQNPNPSIEVQNYFLNQLQQFKHYSSSNPWIRAIAETRSHELQKKYYHWLEQNILSFNQEQKPDAFYILSIHTNYNKPLFEKLALQSLSATFTPINESVIAYFHALAKDKRLSQNTFHAVTKKWENLVRTGAPLSPYFQKKLNELTDQMK